MKIALLSEKYTPDIGGLAISTERLGNLLSSAGHEVRVIAPTSNLLPAERRTLPSRGVSVTRFGAHKRVDDTLVDWFELIVEEHQRERFDILHAYFLPQAGYVTTYAGKYLNVPSVVSIRGNDIERAAFDPAKYSHVMYALQNANAVTTNTNELAKKAKAFHDREVNVIPNGVDTNLFKPLEKNPGLAESLGLTTRQSASTLLDDRQQAIKLQNNPVIGFTGELREKKGLKTLLSAYAQINTKHQTTLLIVGEVRKGEDQQVFDESQASIPNAQIIVTGPISHKNMPAYYALMDVFVHPSLRDGMPNALLEAMACEKAIIATAVGGALEAIEDGMNGKIVPVDDVAKLTKTIEELLDNSNLRKQLGKSARKTVQDRFALEKELADNLAIYQKLK